MNQSLEFFWNPPVSNGGSPILGYSITDGGMTSNTTSRPYTITGLTNGQLYSFTIAASNTHGYGPAASFTPVRPGLYPDAPTDVSGVSNGPWATVSWSNPTYTGDTELLGTVLTAIPLEGNILSGNKARYVRQCVVPPSISSVMMYVSSLVDTQFKVLVQSVNDPGYSFHTAYTSSIGTSISLDGLLVYLDARNYSNGTWVDSGSNGYNATIENGTPSLNGSSNGIVLDGTTNFIFNNPGLLSTFTASSWFKQTGNTDDGGSILTEIYTGGNINVVIVGYTAGLGIAESNFAGAFFNGAWQLGTVCDYSDGLWHNQVVTWDGTTLITYLDGSPVGSNVPGSSPGNSGNQYRIGCRWDAPYFVRGDIGQVLLYDRALSSSEVLMNYSATSRTFV